MDWYFWCVQFENDKNEKKNVIFIGNCFHLRDFTEKKFYVVCCLVNKKSFHIRDCFHLRGFHFMTMSCTNTYIHMHRQSIFHNFS